MIHDVAVIGAGLVGSATARHLARHGPSVALVGPAFGDTTAVFSSHHDQGRVCRRVDRVPTWTALNARSLEGIAELEMQVGMSVRDANGCLVAANDPAHAWFVAAPELEIDAPDVPYGLPGAVRFGFEGPPAGILRVPELLRAQHEALTAFGGTRHPTTLVARARGDQEHVLTLADGTGLRARQVVLCPGAWINDWLDEPLDVVLETETTLLVPVGGAVARRFEGVPTLLWDGHGPGWDGPYVVPPLRFEDGGHWIKLGCDLDSDHRFRETAAVQRWFAEGDSAAQRPVLLDVARTVLPGVSLDGAVTRRCILTRTPHAHPMVGEVEHDVFVGVGGHGWGAMASDGIGELVARTVLGTPWPDDLPPETCAVRWRTD